MVGWNLKFLKIFETCRNSEFHRFFHAIDLEFLLNCFGQLSSQIYPDILLLFSFPSKKNLKKKKINRKQLSRVSRIPSHVSCTESRSTLGDPCSLSPQSRSLDSLLFRLFFRHELISRISRMTHAPLHHSLSCIRIYMYALYLLAGERPASREKEQRHTRLARASSAGEAEASLHSRERGQ